MRLGGCSEIGWGIGTFKHVLDKRFCEERCFGRKGFPGCKLIATKVGFLTLTNRCIWPCTSLESE